MQEKVNKFSFIKQRIMYFVENQSIKKADFFNKIGVTSANFRGDAQKTPINSNAIENIITNYPEINLHWLITGKGEMLIEKEGTKYSVGENQLAVANQPTQDDNVIITILKDQVAELKKDKTELIKDKEKLYNLLETKLGKQKVS